MSSATIHYAYLKGQTWLYLRNYPKEVAALLGQQALKQSLKTSDAKIARQRAAEVNTHYENTVEQALSGPQSLPKVATSDAGDVLTRELVVSAAAMASRQNTGEGIAADSHLGQFKGDGPCANFDQPGLQAGLRPVSHLL